MGFVEVLTLVFIVLKLTGQIDWSWWWVWSLFSITWSLIILIEVIRKFRENRTN